MPNITQVANFYSRRTEVVTSLNSTTELMQSITKASLETTYTDILIKRTPKLSKWSSATSKVNSTAAILSQLRKAMPAKTFSMKKLDAHHSRLSISSQPRSLKSFTRIYENWENIMWCSHDTDKTLSVSIQYATQQFLRFRRKHCGCLRSEWVMRNCQWSTEISWWIRRLKTLSG